MIVSQKDDYHCKESSTVIWNLKRGMRAGLGFYSTFEHILDLYKFSRLVPSVLILWWPRDTGQPFNLPSCFVFRHQQDDRLLIPIRAIRLLSPVRETESVSLNEKSCLLQVQLKQRVITDSSRHRRLLQSTRGGERTSAQHKDTTFKMARMWMPRSNLDTRPFCSVPKARCNREQRNVWMRNCVTVSVWIERLLSIAKELWTLQRTIQKWLGRQNSVSFLLVGPGLEMNVSPFAQSWVNPPDFPEPRTHSKYRFDTWATSCPAIWLS